MNNKSEKQKLSSDLRAKLLKKLEKTGYPTELEVGNIFASCGFSNVEHNRYYIDEDEQKGREIDVCAYKNVYSVRPSLSVGLGLICQVKRSQRHPWVILSTNRKTVESDGWLRLHYLVGQVGSDLLSFDQIESKSTTAQFPRIGRSYYKGCKSGDAKSSIFEALVTATKAAEYWLKMQTAALQLVEKKPIKTPQRSLTFVEPLVVLDGRLYEAYLDDDGQMKLDEVRHIPVSFGYVSAKYSRFGYLVEVVTIKELPNLLTKKCQWLTYMHDSIARKLTGTRP